MVRHRAAHLHGLKEKISSLLCFFLQFILPVWSRSEGNDDEERKEKTQRKDQGKMENFAVAFILSCRHTTPHRVFAKLNNHDNMYQTIYFYSLADVNLFVLLNYKPCLSIFF